MFGEVKKEQKEVFIHYQASLYRAPFSDMKTGSSISPQTVKAFENWTSPSGEKWLHIRTWADDMWVKQDETIPYTVELSKWEIYKDATHPVETTKGFNNLLKWANENSITHVYVPEGSYLIDKDNDIKLVSNMTLELNNKAIMKKETNGHEGYDILYIGDVKNVIVKGGILQGDRETHDYTQKDADWSAGTHEWGHGILTKGAENIVIDGVKFEKFTGDGVEVSGSTIYGTYIKENNLEVGGIDDQGNPIAKTGKIRSFGRAQTNFDHASFKTYRSFYIWLPEGLTTTKFDIYFYKKDGSFIGSQKQIKFYNGEIFIPDEADYYRVVMDAPSTTGVHIQPMTIDITKNLIIKNSDIGNNRRQGISLVGSDNVQILNNYIHDIGGIAPQSGIDIEPGFMPGRNSIIKGNKFENNKINTVLAYGQGVVVEDNYYGKGGIGLYVHAGFSDVIIRDNSFNGSGLTTNAPNSIVTRNHVKDGELNVYGAGSILSESSVTNSRLQLGGANLQIKNVEIIQDGSYPYGAFYVGNEPAVFENITIRGVTKSELVYGKGNPANIYENFKVINDSSKGIGVPQGNFTNCSISGGIVFNTTGEYHLKKCSITSKNNLVNINDVHGSPTVNIEESNFTLTEKIGYGAAFYVTGSEKLTLLNNIFKAYNTTGGIFMKLGPYGTPQPTKIFNVMIKGNTFDLKEPIVGIDTTNAGTDAQPYIFENNTLYNAKIKLKANDVNNDNKELTK